MKGEKPLLDSDSYTWSLRLRQHQEQLDTLLNRYTERHPDVQALRSAIADLKQNQELDNAEVTTAPAGDDFEFNPVYQQIKVEMSKAGIKVETLKIQLAERRGCVDKLRQSIDVIPEVKAKGIQTEP